MHVQQLETPLVWQRRLFFLVPVWLVVLAGLLVLPRLAHTFPSGIGASLSSYNIQSFQADLFTGSAGAEIPIIVPAGAAGVSSKIVIRYNSGVVDDLGIDYNPDQADWTGLGWSLDVGGFVVRNTQGTTITTDDTFQLIFGGETHHLVAIGENYRTEDETFLQIAFNSAGDYWTVKTASVGNAGMDSVHPRCLGP
jgi:hypothetical protein